MIIFTSLVVAVLIFGTTLFSLVYVWKRKDFKSFFVQLVVTVISLSAGIYAIIQYPVYFSIARALDYLSPLK